ncbi:MAG: hypothetical protein CO141_01955 [Candidatus Moranbacteria bacterium CG_4_9_14_3_um_filter_42_9]|nr:MAG: hypothetical protein CO141_01955 [Candidatus Moranbacteria bacterium CG_4_9_14_3_um_filter_42_9]
MLDKKLKDALELLGGKAIIKDGEQLYVLLTIKEFKKIRQEGIGGLTKQELIDRINNDIAAWKSSQEEDKLDALNLDDIGNKEAEDVHYEKA